MNFFRLGYLTPLGGTFNERSIWLLLTNDHWLISYSLLMTCWCGSPFKFFQCLLSTSGCCCWILGFKAACEALAVLAQPDEKHTCVLSPLDWLVLLRQRSMATAFGNRVTLRLEFAVPAVVLVQRNIELTELSS